MSFKRLTPYKYSKLRREIYERDGGQCVLCGGRGAHIHHIVFRSQGGKDAADNLVTLCGSCHEKAHGIGKSAYTQKEIRSLLKSYVCGVKNG